MLQSKIETIEKKEALFTEATFNNSLKNDASKKKDAAKKKDSKKSEKADDDEDYLNLSDEEKDARDYQLQRALDMVRALSKVGKKNLETVETPKEETKAESKETKKSDK